MLFSFLRRPQTTILVNRSLYRLTKAKKKRQARYARRQQMKQDNIEIPKPDKFVPRDRPVRNAIPREERLALNRKLDEEAMAELAPKLQAPQETLRYHMAGLQMSDRVRRLLDMSNGNQREVVQAQKQAGMQAFQLRPGDTGSSAVQVVALTARIQNMQLHHLTHTKDHANKRGLNRLYTRRRKLLQYMERREFENYRKIVKTLGLKTARK